MKPAPVCFIQMCRCLDYVFHFPKPDALPWLDDSYQDVVSQAA